MGEYLFIGSAIFSLVNGTVLLWVNPRRLTNRVFFGSSVAVALWLSCILLAVRAGQHEPFISQPVVFWIRASSVIAAFSIWLIWFMKSVLLKDHASIASVFYESLPWLALSLLLAALTTTESFIPATSNPTNKGRGLIYLVYAAILIFSCALLLTDAVRRMRLLHGVRRIEMQLFVIGSICACWLVIVSHVLGLWLDTPLLRHSSSVWFSILHGMTVWAVCHHRVFDAKQVVLSIGQRLLLLGFAALVGTVSHQFLSQLIGARSSIFLACAGACVVGLALDSPTRRWARLNAQQRLLPPRQQIIEWARVTVDENELERKFSGLLRDFCQTNSVIFLHSNGTFFSGAELSLSKDWLGFPTLCKDGWTTPETLQRSRPAVGTTECSELMHRQTLGALLAVPTGSRSPSLVIGLGQRASLRPYTFPDIQVLLELVELMDNILAHSRAATQTASLERMEAATMISRGLAHDLNNLAMPILAFLHHSENRVVAGTVEATVLADARASIGVMQDYIGESLFFSRKLVPYYSLVGSQGLLSATTELCQDRALRKSIRISASQDGAFDFVADFALMRRMTQNLVFNAIDASPAGGSIDVSVTLVDNTEVCVRVADEGSGIDPDIRNSIFEPYFTTKNAGNEARGIGLGLAICQRIAWLHGGRIAVSTNIPRGSVFAVVFPLRTTSLAVVTEQMEFDPTLGQRAGKLNSQEL